MANSFFVYVTYIRSSRQKVWEASKGVGAVVEGDLRELVKLRNEAATKLGFKNFQQMMLTLNEQDGGELVKLFDELDELTKAPFSAAKVAQTFREHT